VVDRHRQRLLEGDEPKRSSVIAEPPARAELVSFYSGLRDFEAAYHNHKELLGWLGVAAYLVGAIQVALSSLRGPAPAVAVAVATIVVLAYVRRQFNLRFYAAEVVRASSRLAALALAGEGCSAELNPQGIARSHQSGDNGGSWQVFRMVFPQRHNVAQTNLDVLPRAVVTEMTLLSPDRRPSSRAESLEVGTYMLVLVVGLATVLELALR
jgi:hypothetical protein